MKKEKIEALFGAANSLVAEMTNYKHSTRKLRGAEAIVREYSDNTFAVRQMQAQRGVILKNFPPQKM